MPGSGQNTSPENKDYQRLNLFAKFCLGWALPHAGALTSRSPLPTPSSASLPPGMACSSSSAGLAARRPQPQYPPPLLSHAGAKCLWRLLPSVSSRLGVGMHLFLFQHFASTWHFICQLICEVIHPSAGGVGGRRWGVSALWSVNWWGAQRVLPRVLCDHMRGRLGAGL